MITKEITSNRVDVEEVSTKGNSLLARMFSGIYYGDFASYYLALLNNIDPSLLMLLKILRKN